MLCKLYFDGKFYYTSKVTVLETFDLTQFVNFD